MGTKDDRSTAHDLLDLAGIAMPTIFSQRWYRVAALKPRVSLQVQVRRQRVRGTNWYLLALRGGGRAVRLNAAAYAIAARLDGSMSVQEVWDLSLSGDHDAATQDEVIELLAKLQEAGLLRLDGAADFDVLLPHLDTVTNPPRPASLLAWRVPLGDPTSLLNHLAFLTPRLFSPLAWYAWMGLLVLMIVSAAQHAPEIVAGLKIAVLTPQFSLLSLALFVPIKAVHELAHGLAVRRWGGQVHEAGLTLMMLVPVPYMDASAASIFPQRRHRLTVSAAGIMAELAIASAALQVWLMLPDGTGRDAALSTLMITSVSTLIFNANPLLRLDGYFIFVDAMELPNLASRSRNWWNQFLCRFTSHNTAHETMPVAAGEAPWLAAYAPLAWLYLLAVGVAAIVWLWTLSPVLAALAGPILFWQIVIRPAIRWFRALHRSANSRSADLKRWHQTLALSVVILAVVLLTPFPSSTLVRGVVWPAEQTQLRAEEDGVVVRILMHDGQTAQPGDVVLQLENPQLRQQYQQQLAVVGALEAQLLGAIPFNHQGLPDARAGNARVDLERAQTELQRMQDRLAALGVRALVGGRVVLPRDRDLPGQFVQRGTLVGRIMTQAQPKVRVALPQALVEDLGQTGPEVSVWLNASPSNPHAAHLASDSRSAVTELPNAALGTRHGGAIDTDPRDPKGLLTQQPVVLLDVRLDGSGTVDTERIGERVWVRIAPEFAPLLLHAIRWLRKQAPF